MSFASRIARAPRPHDPDLAAETLRALPEVPGPVADLVRGTAGCSPFLRGLLEREAAWLEGAFATEPEDALSEVLRDVAALPAGEVASGLRTAKRRIALLAALADLGGVWPLEEVTWALTRLADAAVTRALLAELDPLVSRGKLPGMTEDDLSTACGMVALAMGKMGAGELNYSSDIDLICLFDETRYGDEAYLDARAVLIRATRRMAATLSDNTAEGYVFRTDLRLRPDPSVTPVCLSMEAAERYYESLGRTWERAAYIKARPCAGDIRAGDRFLGHLTPFVWRKHLDYAAIEEAHDMRLRIREHKGLHGDALEGRNLKLAPGGIREIEFFTQTRQLIAGGRDPDLRVRGTVEGLLRLAEKGWVPDEDAATLVTDYRAHREVEHRLQMIADQQTHDLPSSKDGFARLAAFMDREPDELRADLSDRIARVSRLAEGFFAPGKARPEPTLSPAAAETVARWPSYPALRSDRAMRIFTRLRPELLRRLAKLDRPDEALVHLDGFLAGLPAGVQLFSLFEANPQLIDLFLDIASTAPALASYLSRNSQVFDAVIGGDFFSAWPGHSALEAELAQRLSAADDYERKLDDARRWQKEWHFRIGVHHLRGLIDAGEAAQEYADLAGAVLRAVWAVVLEEFEGRHGTAPGHGAVVLGMGSLGAERLTATSDLDLIVIYDPADAEMSDGRRPLASRAFYARLTQAFVTALTAPMAEGRLYEADMRLRPSGRQGPVATSITSFETYQREEAWTWEHLALTRARLVAGEAALGRRVESFRCDLLAAPHDRAKILADTVDMRARLAAAKPGQGALEAKHGPGRLLDLALLAQVGALLSGAPDRGTSDQLRAGQAALGLSDSDLAALLDADRLMWGVQAATRLMTAGSLDADAIGAGGRALLLREAGAPDIPGLEAALSRDAAAADRIASTALADEG
jgi:[glutamine synthetase] adenylyltransferase / [glutamine synthetase]-adenylyl-L-tyrosine phosphorylase